MLASSEAGAAATIKVIRLVRRACAIGMPLPVAGRYVVRAYPDTCLMCLEHVGMWDSSDPEIAAVQGAWAP